MDNLTLLNSGWAISHPLKYILLAILLSLAVRLVSSVLRSIELKCWKEDRKSIFTLLMNSFLGFGDDPLRSDLWFPFIVGTIEFACYPIIMATGAWIIIGAWLTLKTLPQWTQWTEYRHSFNRFLIGNALVVILALLVLGNMVTIKTDAQPCAAQRTGAGVAVPGR